MSNLLTKKAYLSGFIAAMPAIPIARFYFGTVEMMAASSLMAISLMQFLKVLLEKNRREIWEEKKEPFQVNSELTLQFCALFFGICTFALLFQVIAEGIGATRLDSREMYLSSIPRLISHNLQVLAAATCIGIIYREGGLVIILAWNALHWSESLVGHLSYFYDRAGIIALLLACVSVIPHLVLEVVAYVLGGIGGVFISKGIFKYSLESSELRRVSKASLVCVIAGSMCIIAAAVSEGTLIKSLLKAISTR